MRSFSPFYFIKENKLRCFLLIFMLFLGYVAYLGGLYVSNPLDNWELPFENQEKIVTAYPSNDVSDTKDFEKFLDKLENTNKVQIISCGVYNAFMWKTIMGFESGSYAFTFTSIEDFKDYCAYMDIECDMEKVKDGSLIISERLAKNRGLSIGDTVDSDFGNEIHGEFKVDVLTQEEGYTQYYIDENGMQSGVVAILGKNMDNAQLKKLVYEVAADYQVAFQENLQKEITVQFETFHMIYLFILVLMAVILSVTINAAFVGMYQRRNLEFAVYRAIGITKGQIIRKIAGELLCMEIVALVAGGGIFFFALYLFNHLVLYPAGKYLCYFQPVALFGLLLCNLAVLIPLIITRSRQAIKADVCEY